MRNTGGGSKKLNRYLFQKRGAASHGDESMDRERSHLFFPEHLALSILSSPLLFSPHDRSYKDGRVSQSIRSQPQSSGLQAITSPNRPD